MRGNRWGIEGPPEEAYSRVTDPERFQPLHDAALELLDRLEREFAVERLEGSGGDDELGGRSHVRPTIRLVPHDPQVRANRGGIYRLSRAILQVRHLAHGADFPAVAATPATKRPTG